MFIPPKHLSQAPEDADPIQGVVLKFSHLIFGKELVEAVFKDEMNVYLAFYPDKGFLVLSAISHAFFKKMHDASQHMLKIKHSRGERSLALHELLIDHDLAIPDGPLRYEIKETSKILKIYLSEG